MKTRTTAVEKRLAANEGRLADLERRIAELEKVPRDWPWTPTIPCPAHPQPVFDHEARCPVCQNRYSDMTHYVCNHERCPNRVYCGTTTDTTYHFGDPPLGSPGHVVATCRSDTSATLASRVSSVRPSA